MQQKGLVKSACDFSSGAPSVQSTVRAILGNAFPYSTAETDD